MMTELEKAQLLLLEACQQILKEENMMYSELNAFLRGDLSPSGVITILEEHKALQASEAH
jgi:hypothetical protein